MKPEDCTAQRVARIVAEEALLGAVEFRSGSDAVQISGVGQDERAERRITAAFAPGNHPECSIGADGRCAACGAVPALGAVRITRTEGLVTVEKPGCPTSVDLRRKRELRLPGFAQREPAPIIPTGPEHDEDEWKLLAKLAAGCLLTGIAAYSASKLGAPSGVVLTLWLASYVSGAWEAAEEAWETLREGNLDVHFLMLMVALGAAAVGDYPEGALLLFLFSASGAMEHYAEGRTRREIGSLLRGAPKTAVVVGAEGSVQNVPVEALAVGQVLRVTGGQQIPVDLRVTRGETTCDESNLTGEALPVPKAVGDITLGGTMNGGGVIEGTVLRPASQSALAKVIQLIENSQRMRAPSQRFTDRFGTGYTYAVLGLCTVMFFVWWLGFGLPPFHSSEALSSAFYRSMTLLVVASPCALVLSIPSAILSAIAAGARRGVLFRGGAAVETLALIGAVAMDKTGTLTEGDLQVTRVESFPPGREAEVEAGAFNLDRFSDHPLARATQRYGRRRGLTETDPAAIRQVPGNGLRGELGGHEIRIGRREFAVPDFDPAAAPPAGPAAEVWLGTADLVGRLLYIDQPRPAAAAVLQELKAQGIESVMLTGDRREAAEKLAAEVGLTSVRAQLLPADKVRHVEELKRGGTCKVAMIGDGVNDAPCLAAADVGVAMGARGSDAALEQADVILMNDRLESFLTALRLSRRAKSVIQQNLVISLGTVVVMVGASLFGIVPLALGVVAHEGSTVLVVLNSLRLLLEPRSTGTARK